MIRLESQPGPVVRWSGALLVIAAGLVAPYLHWVYGRWDADLARSLARTVALTLLFLWFVGRALAVLIVDRFTRARLAARSVEGVSVIVPCHNAAKKVDKCVRSILEQDLRPIEIILVENKSTDDTWNVLLELEKRHPEVRVPLRPVVADQPTRLGELLSDPDPERARRATEAMLQMKKIDIAGARARAGGP